MALWVRGGWKNGDEEMGGGGGGGGRWKDSGLMM